MDMFVEMPYALNTGIMFYDGQVVEMAIVLIVCLFGLEFGCARVRGAGVHRSGGLICRKAGLPAGCRVRGEAKQDFRLTSKFILHIQVSSGMLYKYIVSRR